MVTSTNGVRETDVHMQRLMGDSPDHIQKSQMDPEILNITAQTINRLKQKKKT